MTYNTSYFKELLKTHPELLEFLSDAIDATHDGNRAEAPAKTLEAIYSAAQEILGNDTLPQRSIELERTMLGIMAMEAVYDDNYKFFEDTPVPFAKPLSQEQFDEIRDLLLNNFPQENRKILQTALVLGDLGKIRSLRENLSREFNIEAQDPDQFMSALLEQPHDKLKPHLPSIAALTPAEFESLKQSHTGFHYGHFAHTESTERELTKLKAIIDERGITALHKNILIQLFDVAGAAAQDNGKILLNNVICGTYMEDILPSLETLEQQSPAQVYRAYLVKRLTIAEVLSADTQPETLEPTMRLLGRLLCMLRIYNPQEAKDLNDALTFLSSDPDFPKALSVLDTYQKKTSFQTPTYMPAFLTALKDNPEVQEVASKIELSNLTTVLFIGLHIIAMSLSLHENLVDNEQIPPTNPVNFNGLTGIVKESGPIKALIHEKETLSIGKNDGIVYPTTWLATHKPDQAEEYVSAPVAHTPVELTAAYPGLNFFNSAEQQPSKNPKAAPSDNCARGPFLG